MALITSAATGNFNSTSTWTGGVVPGAADEARVSNGHIVTITANTTCIELSNTGTGTFVLNAGVTLTANVTHKGGTSNVTCLTYSSAGSSVIYGNITNSSTTPIGTVINSSSSGTLSIYGNLTGGNGNGTVCVNNSSSNGTVQIYGNVTASVGSALGLCLINTSTGTISVQGNITGGTTHAAPGLRNSSGGIVNIQGNITGVLGAGVESTSTGTIQVSNSTITAGTASGISNASGLLSVANCTVIATQAANGITSSGTNNRLSGIFVNASNGQQAVNAVRWIMGILPTNAAPTNAYIQHALDGINSNSFVRFYTADNNLSQANPTDVRSGVNYASGALTGRLTVPARGSVALSVNYGPSMPFTATSSGTTATATLAYSYPFVVGDQITVTGASNAEWNSTYTIASVVNDTSVTFTVPSTHSATAGTGALLQTTGTAVLDPAAVASAVWGAASRTITGGLVDTATTLTNSPDVPTESEIAAAVRTELATELGRLDAAVSSRLAPNGTLATVTTLTNAPAVPSAAAIADEVRVELATELARIDAPISGAGNAPSAATVASAVRTELAAELARVDAAVSSRLAGSAYSAPATPPTPVQIRQEIDANSTKLDVAVSSRLAASESTKLDAVKAKTDALNTERLANVATTAIVGNLIAQANS
jgi:hypothetical protein